MFDREVISDLENWRRKKSRKPLILRGARQVGKTSLVNLFARNFDQYIHLNLEIPENKSLFEDSKNLNELVDGIFYFITSRRISLNA